MKATLYALFVGLLMVGCEEISTPSTSVGSPKAIDLDDNESRDKIIAEAIDSKKACLTEPSISPWNHRRWLVLATQKPYTGWMKHMHANGQVKKLFRLKDGRQDGQFFQWDESGRKMFAGNIKDHRSHGLSANWYRNGQKKEEGTYKGGLKHGLWTFWDPNGKKETQKTYKDGKLWTATRLKPNGEKCPVSKINVGNGTWVRYKDNGTEYERQIYKDGQVVGTVLNLWYKTGQKREEATYRDNRLWTAVVWKPSGEKCPHTNVENGDGVLVRYDSNGADWNGTEGLHLTYRDGGIVFQKTYKNGEKVED